LRRKPDAVKVALAGRESQTQAVIRRPAAADVAQEPRRSQVGSGREGRADAGSHEHNGRGTRCAGNETQTSWLWQAGNCTRGQSCAGRQGHIFRRRPDAVKMALAGMETQKRQY
jgi:hypothetical protein